MTEEKLMSELEVFEDPEEVTNPFTGVSCTLEPEAVALYDFIKGCESTGLYSKMEFALGIFRRRWPKEYMTLLD